MLPTPPSLPSAGATIWRGLLPGDCPLCPNQASPTLAGGPLPSQIPVLPGRQLGRGDACMWRLARPLPVPFSRLQGRGHLGPPHGRHALRTAEPAWVLDPKHLHAYTRQTSAPARAARLAWLARFCSLLTKRPLCARLPGIRGHVPLFLEAAVSHHTAYTSVTCPCHGTDVHAPAHCVLPHRASTRLLCPSPVAAQAGANDLTPQTCSARHLLCRGSGTEGRGYRPPSGVAGSRLCALGACPGYHHTVLPSCPEEC